MAKDKKETDDSPIFTSMVRVGHEVPDLEFEVFHNDKIKKVRISDYKGKWLVIFFYPADFTFVCPTELEELADSHKEFADLDTEIVSMSSDTAFAHKAWHDTSPAIQKIKFAMGSDPAGRLSRAFGTYIEGAGFDCADDEGLSLRGTFVVDPDGIVSTMEIHANSIGRSAKELIRKIQAAQFVRAHGGQVCPAEWQPGEDTLKGGDLDLVGKI